MVTSIGSEVQHIDQNPDDAQRDQIHERVPFSRIGKVLHIRVSHTGLWQEHREAMEVLHNPMELGLHSMSWMPLYLAPYIVHQLSCTFPSSLSILHKSRKGVFSYCGYTHLYIVLFQSPLIWYYSG
jgi:hypothetical protein